MRPRRGGLTFRGLVGALTVAMILPAPLVMWAAGVRPPWAPPPSPPLPALAIVRGMSELVTTEVHLSTFLEGGNKHWEIKVLVHGQCRFGVDLAQAEYLDVDPVKRRAVLRLPQPHLSLCKIDHDRSFEVHMRKKVWFASDPQLVRSEVWKAAERKIDRLGRDEVYIQQARKQAEVVLHQLFQGIQWNVHIRWIDDDAKAKDAPPPRDSPKVADQPGIPPGKNSVQTTTDAVAKG